MKLFLCEKPSQAKDIARVIGAHQRRDNFFQGNGVQVAWARGHLLEQAEPEAYGAQFAAPGGRVPYPLFLNSGKWWLKKTRFRCFRP